MSIFLNVSFNLVFGCIFKKSFFRVKKVYLRRFFNI